MSRNRVIFGVAFALGLVLILYARLPVQIDSFESTIPDLDRRPALSHSIDEASLVYMMASVASAAALLLVSGVLVTAPLVSLALHQSYDTIFSVWQQVTQKPTDPDGEAVARSAASHLERAQRLYRWFNPVFLVVWLFSVLALGAMLVVVPYSPLDSVSAFRLAWRFLLVGAAICFVFGAVTVTLWVLVRPGQSKLDLLTQYLGTRPWPYRDRRSGRDRRRGGKPWNGVERRRQPDRRGATRPIIETPEEEVR
jgi:hypothetical protein